MLPRRERMPRLSHSRNGDDPLCPIQRGCPYMTPPFPPELLTTFRAMAEVVYSGESYDSVYDSLCQSAVEFVDGCDHASLMLRRHGRVQTVGASDELARVIDELERALEQGPCLDAIDDSEP